MFNAIENLKNDEAELNWTVKQDEVIIIQMLQQFKLLLVSTLPV